MKINTITATAYLGLVMLLFPSCSKNTKSIDTSAAHPPTNFVLLMGDDHGWDEVGYNGHPHIKTPVLDDMATQGLRLDRFYSGHPSCSPTRGSFMTGRHPNRYGTFAPNWSIRPEEISIAHILGEAGYASAHYGKWHLGPVKKDSPTSPGAMGFDEWLSHDNFFELNPVLSRNGEIPQQFEGEGSQIIIDEAIQFIRKTKQNKQPFLVVVWYGSPHEPYSGLPADLDLYNDLPIEYADQTVGLTSNETGKSVQRPLRDVLQERYAEITAMDRSIGVLRDFLKEEGLRENTLLWYCGDNGTPASAARTGMTLRGQKGMMYEGGIRVPGVIEWPARIQKSFGSRVNSVTSDILPTLCDVAGLSLPNRPLDGISLAPVINGDMHQRTSPIFFWHFEPGSVFNEASQSYIEERFQEGTTPLVKMMAGKYTRTFRNLQYPEVTKTDIGGARTMVDNNYKLLIDAGDSQESVIELYDITNDPSENNNLASVQPDVVESMQRQLYNWQQSVLKSLTAADYQ